VPNRGCGVDRLVPRATDVGLLCTTFKERSTKMEMPAIAFYVLRFLRHFSFSHVVRIGITLSKPPRSML
jgi:hypothetical protein